MENLNGLKGWLKGLGWIWVALEALSAIVAGALLGTAFGGGNGWVQFSALVAIAVFAVLLCFRLYSQNLFAEQAIGSLQLEQELATKEAELKRRELLFENLDDSVQRLNEQTCSITEDTADTYPNYIGMITSSLSKVAHPVVSSPNNLLQCSVSNFSVMARIEIRPPGKLSFEEEFIILRDDLTIGHLVTRDDAGHDCVDDPHATTVRLDIGTFAKKVMNENRYLDQTYGHNNLSPSATNDGLTLIGIPIPLICDDSTVSGVLIIAAGTSMKCCGEVPVVLVTYAKLIASWLNQYSIHTYDLHAEGRYSVPEDSAGNDA